MSKIEKPNEAFVIFKNRIFTSPFLCLCCGKEISIEQFSFGRCCAYCDVGRCLGMQEGHGRKDLFYIKGKPIAE